MISFAIMFIRRCLQLVLTDIRTPSCLHHFLLEFLGTALFLCASLSAVLIFPSAGVRQPLSSRSEGNQSHLSDLYTDWSLLVNLSGDAPLGSMCHSSNLSHPSNLCNQSLKTTLGHLLNQSKLWNHCQLNPVPVPAPSCLQVALAFGLSVAIAAVCVGGEVHLNPAITIAMVLTLKLRLWRAVLYVIGQLLGGVASAALLLMLIGDVTPAVNQVVPGVRLYQAIAIETLATFQLIMVVLALVNTNLPPVMSNMLVGLSVSLGHFIALSATGCGMNPARSLGPAVVTLEFKDHWVFWAGPNLGAFLAALLNDLLLRPRWCHLTDWWAELKQLYVIKDKQQQMALSNTP